MSFITDGFGRTMQHEQDQLDASQMKSLLMNDVKMNRSKKATKNESPEQIQARKVVEDLLSKIVKQDIDGELKKLRESIDRSTKLNEEYYTKEKKSNTFAMGNIVGLGKIIGDVVKAAMTMPQMAGFTDKRQIELDAKSYELNRKWFSLEEKMSHLAVKDYRINYLDARQKGVLAGKERETPREAVLVDKQLTSPKQREDIASKPILTSAYKASESRSTIIPETRWQEETADATDRLAKAGLEKGSIYTHDEGTHLLLQYIIKKVHGQLGPTGMVKIKAKAREYDAAQTTPAPPTPTKKSWWERIFGNKTSTPTTTPPPTPTTPQKSWWERTFGSTLTGKTSRIPVTSPNAFDGRTFHRIFSPDRIAKNLGKAMTSERPAQDILLAARSGIGGLAAQVTHIPVIGKLLKDIPIVGGSLEGAIDEITTFLVDPVVQQMSRFQDIRQTAFQTEGINVGPGGTAGVKAQAEALKAYTLGVSEVETTGQNLLVIQKMQLNNWKRGIRDAQTLNKVTVTGLHIATMLGSAAEETARMFADWHQNLGMSTTDLSLMGLGLRDIARTTGLTGDNLIQVAKSSEQFMKNMRMAGTLNPGASTNITRLMAEATKTGTQESMQRMLAIMSKGMLNGEGDPRTRMLAIMAAGNDPDLMNQMMSGTILRNPANMKRMAANMQGTLNSFTGGRNLAEIDPHELGKLSQVIESAFGVGAQEFQLLIDSARKAGRDFTERYEELQGVDAKSVENRQALVFSQTAMYIDALKKNGGNFDKLVQEMPDFLNFAKTMGITRANPDEQLRKLLIGKEGGLEDKIRAIGKVTTRDVAGNETTQTAEQLIAELKNAPFEKILEIEQKVANQTRANQDPISHIEQSVKQIQADLAKIINIGLLDANIITEAIYKSIDFIRGKQWDKLKELWTGLGMDLQKELGDILNWWQAAIKDIDVGKMANWLQDVIKSIDVGKIVSWWWDEMKAGMALMREWAQKVREALASINWKEAGREFGEWVKNIDFKAIGAWIGDNWRDILVFTFFSTFEFLYALAGSLLKGFGEFIVGFGESIAKTFPALGHAIEAIGQAFRSLGMILHGLSDLLTGFATGDNLKNLKGVDEVLSGLGGFLLSWFDLWFMSYVSIIQGGFELLFKGIEGLVGLARPGGLAAQMMSWIHPTLDWIRGFFSDMVNEIQRWFNILYDYLLGHSVIPDIVEGIIHWFAKLPRAIGDIFKKLGNQFDNKFLKTIFNDIGSIGEGFADLLESITDIFTGNWTKESSDKMWQGIQKLFGAVPAIILDLLGLLADGTAKALLNIFSMMNPDSFFAKIIKLFGTAFEHLGGIFEGLRQILKGFIGGNENRDIQEGWKKVWENIKGFIEDGVKDLTPILTSIGNKIGKGIMEGIKEWFTPTSIEEAFKNVNFWDIALLVLFPPLGIANILDKMFPNNKIWEIAFGILFPPLGIAMLLNKMFPKIAETISSGGELLVAVFKDVMANILNGLRGFLKNNFGPLWDISGMENKWKVVEANNMANLMNARKIAEQKEKDIAPPKDLLDNLLPDSLRKQQKDTMDAQTQAMDAQAQAAIDAANELLNRESAQKFWAKPTTEPSWFRNFGLDTSGPAWFKDTLKLIETPIEKMSDAALNKGSIYTCDEHVFDNITNLIERLDEPLFIDMLPPDIPTMQPLLKGIMMAFMDAESEVRKRNMDQAGVIAPVKTEIECDELCNIESSAEENVEQTKKMIELLDAIKKALTAPKKTRNGGVGHPRDMFEENIPDPVLNTDWLSNLTSDYVSFDIDIDRH